jgi:hypothetical protein
VKFSEDVNLITNELDDIGMEKAEIEELDIIIDEFRIKCHDTIK